ncbi:MAG: acyltransferase [Acidimicrobiales bacterium]|nr:acyltransferase [Acidimicrobiales bacterium]
MQLNPAKMARPVHSDGRRYVPAIDGLRVLAAFGVISAHVGSEYGPSQQLVAYYGAAAYPALIVFFTISGFLVYRPFARAALAPGSTPKRDRSTSFWVYLLRRVLRIFPLYWAVLGVTVAVAAATSDGPPLNLEGPIEWAQAIFLLPFPDPNTLLQGPLGIAMWTLAIELPFYVFVPLWSAGLKALRRRALPQVDIFTLQVCAVVALIAGLYLTGLVVGGELAFPVMSLPIGMLFAILETRQSLARRRYRPIRFLADNWAVCLAAYVGLVLISAQLALDAYDVPGVTDPYDHIRNIYFPMQAAMALLLFVPAAFASKRSLYARFMAAAPLQMLAPLTYGIYLWHVPLIHYTSEWFGPGFLGFPFPGTTGFGMPTLFIAIGLAICTFVFVELPAAKLRDKVDAWSRGHRPDHAPDPDEDDEEPSEFGGGADLVLEQLPERSWVPQEKEPVVVRGGDGSGGRHLERRALSRAGEDASPAVRAVWCEPIDGFRAICACLAVAGHTFLASSIMPFAGALHVLGILVALFFAISAFVLYQPFIESDVRRLERPDTLGFYVRRLLRIYPLFAFALTVYLIVLPEVRPDNLWAYARLYLFLQIFGEELSGFKGLPSAWYLCNEVIFYFFIPLLAMVAARWSSNRRFKTPGQRLRGHLMIGWGMVFFGPLLRTLLYAADVPAPTSLPFSHMEYFGFGIVVAAHTVGARLGVAPPSFFRWVRRHTTETYVLVLIPVLMLAAIGEIWGDGSGIWSDGNIEDQLRFFPYLLAVILLMSAAAVGPRDDPSNRWLSAKRFKPLSALALHIYLWHQLVLGVINRLLQTPDGSGGIGEVDFAPRFVMGVVLVAVALGGTIAVAWVTQPVTDWPYERYRSRHGLLRARGAPRDAGKVEGSATVAAG